MVLQSIMIDDFYRQSKERTLREINKHTKDILNSNDFELFEKTLKAESFNNEVCIKVLTKNHKIIDVNNKVGCEFEFDEVYVNEIRNELATKNNHLLVTEHKLYGSKVIIYGSNFVFDGEKIIVLTGAKIAPIDAMMQTFEKQIFLIIFVIIISTFFLALVLGEIVIRPIQEITEEVKQLFQGKYHSLPLSSKNTELARLNEALVKANHKIIESDRAKKELIANVSHDLRTPLTMIQGYAEMIRDIKEENNPENINVIIKETERLSVLVNDLLDLNRLNHKVMNLHMEKIYVNTLITDVYHQFETAFKRENIQAELEILVEDQEIKIDVFRIKQVLYNFINNAMVYNNNEVKKVRIKALNLDGIVEIGVYDNGIGIKEEEFDFVFERYYRNNEHHKRFVSGSGIGLALAKEILNAHELKFGVRSEVGRYTEFYFRIPLDKPKELFSRDDFRINRMN